MKCERNDILTPAFHFPHPIRIVLKVLFWCQVLAILWFALLGGTTQAQLQWLLGVDDLAMHLLAFLVTSATAFLLWAPLGAIALFLVCGAAFIEFAQALMPNRQPSLPDFLASSLGILIGAIVARYVLPKIAIHVSRAYPTIGALVMTEVGCTDKRRASQRHRDRTRE